MKWLIVYACRINGVLTFGNTVLPDELPPMNWITIANRENRIEKDRKVIREYTLINFWRVSDYEASQWEDDGTGYLFPPIKDDKKSDEK
jgi:hypothetical protein